ENNIVAGSGSVELIRMIARAFLKPGEKILTSEKSFVMYKIAAVETGGKDAFVEAPMSADYRYDLQAMYNLVDQKTKIIFIANPNNPTGTLLPKKELVEFIDKVPRDVFIVLDNAYQEYVMDGGCEEDAHQYVTGTDMAVSRKNVIVLRTFSKIYGLAGLRIGYAIANETVISYLGRVKAPFNVTRVAQKAALASLRDDEFKNLSAVTNVKNREKLFRQLTEAGLKVVPSKANFLLFFPETDIPSLNVRLLKEGVIIRPVKGFGVPDGMRVSVGTEKENDFFVEKLTHLLSEMKAGKRAK
ncbi:MAG: aminotransferase class I/II-fold pyridoxal phosphate-dependent enzyme, partial [bacterium]|nr:aminotransferase class I/II-fold pyridoxal phosphate-dependent enzyme [bacterium]